jgi:hypothetical protein
MTARATGNNKTLKNFFSLFVFSEEMSISMALSFFCALMTSFFLKGPYADRKLLTWAVIVAVFSGVFLLSFLWLYNRYSKGINWQYRIGSDTSKNTESESQKDLREEIQQMERDAKIHKREHGH